VKRPLMSLSICERPWRRPSTFISQFVSQGHICVDPDCLSFRIEAARRGLVFRMDVIDIPRFVIGDSKKIRTVLGNLVANASAYLLIQLLLFVTNVPQQ
jgi:signal transduction histidine kinase